MVRPGALFMTVTYDPDADVLCFWLSDQPIDEGDEIKPGVIVSYDAWGRVVSLEILAASRHVPDVHTIEFSAFGPLSKPSDTQAAPKQATHTEGVR